jgi:hypothetical protein
MCIPHHGLFDPTGDPFFRFIAKRDAPPMCRLCCMEGGMVGVGGRFREKGEEEASEVKYGLL